MYSIKYASIDGSGQSDVQSTENEKLVNWLKQHLGTYDNVDKLHEMEKAYDICITSSTTTTLSGDAADIDKLSDFMIKLIDIRFKQESYVEIAKNHFINTIKLCNIKSGTLIAVIAGSVDSQINYCCVKIKVAGKSGSTGLQYNADITSISFLVDE